MDLQTAIDAHMQWRVKLRAAINRTEQLDAAVIGKDSQCELGKWLASDGKMRFGAKPEFQKLVTAHRHFHVCAAQVASACNAGKSKEAEALLNGAFSKHSQETVSAIQACKKACM
jgi:methyl-accepting chemotaxis protein